jgi:hypothetical protein
MLEHDRHVEVAGGEPPEGGAPVHQLILDHLRLQAEQLSVPRLEDPGRLGGQVHERGEERA